MTTNDLVNENKTIISLIGYTIQFVTTVNKVIQFQRHSVFFHKERK